MAGRAPRNSEHRRTIYLFLIIAGLLLSGGSATYSYWYRSSVLSFEYVPDSKIREGESEVDAIDYVRIPRLGLSVAVVDGYIEDGKWSVPRKRAAHLVQSALPGSGGNVVIYGHNTENVFTRLADVHIGDQIRIEGDDRVTVYEVAQMQEVAPSEVGWVEPGDEDVLTIFTCTGLFDHKRLVVRAVPVAV